MEFVKQTLRAGNQLASDIYRRTVNALLDARPGNDRTSRVHGRSALQPSQRITWSRVASGVGASVAAILAATLAVTGGAGEPDARTSFILEPQVRYVAEFTGASVGTQARPPGAPVPVRADVAPPFIWPVKGPITSYMGAAHPLGIDIGLSTERSRRYR